MSDQTAAAFLPRSRAAVRRIAALAGLILIVVTTGAVGLLAYAAVSVNAVQESEERALVARHLERSLSQAMSDISTSAVWDGAYVHLQPRVDAAWADPNIGAYYATYLGCEQTLVLNGENGVAYAWRGERPAPPAQAAAFVADISPLIEQVREQEGVGRRLDPKRATFGVAAAIGASGVVRSGGLYHLVAVTTVVPQTAAPKISPGPAPLLVTSKPMDRAYLEEVAQDLGLKGLRFAPHGARSASAPLTDVNGFVVADLAWVPKRPGAIVLQQAIPLLVAAMGVMIAAAVAMAARIRGVFRDLALNDATLNHTLEELVRARDQADAANIAKSQFLANMSHEIRTPLNGILGMTQVMGMDDLPERQRNRLEVVQESGRTLLTVLNDILDISKIEAGRLEIDNHEFDLEEAVAAACSPFASLASQKDIGFRVEIAPDARGRWWGDGARLRQVVSNLASNAVKFTHQGEVGVTVTREGEGLRFAVQDSGIGIPAARLGDLFQKFSQVDASTTRRFGGTGLGLAICRQLAELMGGRLTVESREGEGSRFIADLPFEWRGPAAARASAQDGAAAPQLAPEQPLRILAAEDNATNQLILRALLEPLGVDLTVAGDGAAAVEAFGASRFDLILMDVQMPVMNGVEATGEIRRLEAERSLPPTPILALSANVMSHQVNQYLEAGMNGFVPKPIDAQALFAAIEATLTPQTRSAAAA
jgi:signal transduction histidine kinase